MSAWIIDGEWSRYHDQVAMSQGWSLVYIHGVWVIASMKPDKFSTNQAAEEFVQTRADQGDPLAGYAMHALVVANMRGDVR